MENLQKETPTFERHDMEKTPFSIIKEIPTNKCRIAIGNNLMYEEEFESIKKAEEFINEKPWELLLNTMALMATNIINQLNNKENA